MAPYEMALENGAGLMSTTNGQERDRVWLFGGMDTSLSASSGVSTGSWRIFSRVRPKWVSTGEPLLRVKPKDLAAAGVERVRRVTGVQHGQPQLEDGRRIDVANVIWCTGFHPGFPGSISRYLAPKGRFNTVASSSPSPGSIFWASSSSTRSHPSRSTVWGEMLLTSPMRLRLGEGKVVLIDR